MRAIHGFRWTLALLPSLAGCASLGIDLNGDQDEAYRRTIEVDGTYDEAWRAVIETFAELELPIATLEKESGLIATDWILLAPPDQFMACGQPVRNQEARYNVFLRASGDDDPEMTITSSYRAVAREGAEEGALVRCASTERMEEEIQERVRETLD